MTSTALLMDPLRLKILRLSPKALGRVKAIGRFGGLGNKPQGWLSRRRLLNTPVNCETGGTDLEEYRSGAGLLMGRRKLQYFLTCISHKNLHLTRYWPRK